MEIFLQVVMMEYIPSIIDPDKKFLFESLKSSIAEIAQTRAEWEALSRIEVLREMATEEVLLAGLAVESYDLAVALMKGMKEDHIQEGV
ncbi:peptide ABC transporter ATPase [Methanolacinia paynteri]|uniref:peptide ABC transporter ATPase n=1 Tax=Methanolacinia paynteri TaxID=230356 RepID=UPI001FE1FE3A|nr:peptide ABC transporter ATPase [Methanolacinia paynteri]